jgi:hypothetical protein
MYILCKIMLHHTTNFALNILNEVFGDRLVSFRLWLEKSPDFSPFVLHWRKFEKILLKYTQHNKIKYI